MNKRIKIQCKKVMFLLLVVLYLPCLAENAVRNVKYVSGVKVTFLRRGTTLQYWEELSGQLLLNTATTMLIHIAY